MDTVLCFKANSERREQIRHSKIIDQEILQERTEYYKTIKILLLGASECGKSTFLKQMRILHGQDFDVQDLLEFRSIIYGNIIRIMKVLVTARRSFEIQWKDSSHQNYADQILNFNTKVNEIEPHEFVAVVDMIRELWLDEAIQETYRRRNEYILADSTKYFMDRLEVIGKEDYVPIRKDALRMRKATKTIVEFTTTINKIPFVFIDVGGQRSQRRKWLQCFESITAILFLAAASDYNQVSLEDRKTNRLLESLEIFGAIVNHELLAKASKILFLNKIDLLEERLTISNIKNFFSAFNGDENDLTTVKEFILQLFSNKMEANNDNDKSLYHHYTIATDTENIKVVFRDVKQTILQERLGSLLLH
ncbi:uncharacterized protein TRIADDRAFT_21874 [Trichoplax adhaerens]|uniref:Uncharacterized protein n=1 Tax=Trichoplax adhaerens TaxID=10228 RepID=B3RQB6_TRIAD|nr:hypothetical protein TRIADDRAFT_21874 [Trichoplax adhaerens]EDV27799.1 hypothetical protein TRIADDRAFT_21874 [Trichoplax adhaerens]|eukprot:XP_002109633.1 hypothetical protein TRIADDRAFT_21874 [Trichoplax adhaerens]